MFWRIRRLRLLHEVFAASAPILFLMILSCVVVFKMLYILFLASALIGCASADPCRDLCNKDGPTVCTKGSWAENRVCRHYFFVGNPSEGRYCYHTKETASTCPGTGQPVAPEDVARLIGGNDRKQEAGSSGVNPTVDPVQRTSGKEEERKPTEGPRTVKPRVSPTIGVFESIVVEPSGTHKATVFLLHGKSGKPEHMLRLGEGSWMRNLGSHTKFVSLKAPGGVWFNSLVSSPAEMAMRVMMGQEVADRVSLDGNMGILSSMIDREASLVSGGYRKVFLVGYSQGGMLSLWTALAGGRNLGGVAVMNSAVPILNVGRSVETSTPIVHFHGIQDQIVPIQMARMGHARALAAGAVDYELREAPGSHDPSSGVASQVSAWLAAKIV